MTVVVRNRCNNYN